MPYKERLKRYEEEKRQLWGSKLSVTDYCKAIKKLAKKWRI